jgi:Tfp pilus assembly protein PilO
MPRNFDIAALWNNFSWKTIAWSSPQTLVRIALGVLLVANVVAAGFAFHIWGDSPQDLESKIEATQSQLAIARAQLNRGKQMASKISLARDQGGSFINTYMTPRKATYSTILGELNQMAAAAGVKTRETALTRDAVEGSNSLSMLTVTAGYETSYPNLLKFVNLLDKSQRFLIIDTLQAAPQASTGLLLVTIKLYTFVRDDSEDQI